MHEQIQPAPKAAWRHYTRDKMIEISARFLHKDTTGQNWDDISDEVKEIQINRAKAIWALAETWIEGPEPRERVQ